MTGYLEADEVHSRGHGSHIIRAQAAGAFEEARRAFARVKSLAPAELETAGQVGGFFLKRGNTHFAARRWMDVIIAYEEVLAYSPGLTDTSLNLWHALGHDSEAGP